MGLNVDITLKIHRYLDIYFFVCASQALRLRKTHVDGIRDSGFVFRCALRIHVFHYMFISIKYRKIGKTTIKKKVLTNK